MTVTSTPSTIFSEGVLLAGASAYVYLATFLYEYGYCSYFSLPIAFISPNLSTILVAAAAIGGVLISALKLLGLSAPLFRAAQNPRGHPYREFLGSSAFWLILGILLGVIYGWSWKGALIFLAIVAALQGLYFVPVLLFDRKKPLRDRFEKYAQGMPDQLDLPVLLIEWHGVRWLMPAVLLAFVLLLSFLAGNGEAARKERFLTLGDAPDIAILRNYGDLLIGARIDRATK